MEGVAFNLISSIFGISGLLTKKPPTRGSYQIQRMYSYKPQKSRKSSFVIYNRRMEKAAGWLGTVFLSEDEMRRARAKAAGIPFVLLERDDVVPEALMLIPEPLSRTHSVVAYRAHEGAVEVAMLDSAAL